jgi:nucleoside-diphosphate-sugar epimerase
VIVSITGGTGFIGRAVALRHALAGDEVRVLSRRAVEGRDPATGITVIRGDLSAAADLLARFADGSQVLYHCAGEIRNPAAMEAVHVVGTARLLSAAAHRIGRWVHLSSVGVYGPRADGLVAEETTFNPSGIYEQTKASGEKLVAAQAQAGGFAWCILRPSIVFGVDMPNASLAQLVNVIARGWFFFIGAPGASAPYVPVENVVAALMLCGCSPAAAGRCFNLSDHRTLEQFVSVIASALGRPVPTHRLPQWLARSIARIGGKLPRFPLTQARVDALTTRARYSQTRIEAELDYRPELALEEALTRFVQQWGQDRRRG